LTAATLVRLVMTVVGQVLHELMTGSTTTASPIWLTGVRESDIVRSALRACLV